MKRTILVFLIYSQRLIAQDFNTHFNLANEHFKHGKYQKARDEYDRAFSCNSNCYQALYNTGLAFACEGNIDNALHFYELAIKNNPNYTKAHLMLAQAYKQKNMIDHALQHLESAIALDNNNVDALTQAGTLYAEHHQEQKALEYLKQATTLQPNNTSILLDYGNALTMYNQLDEALNMYNAILRSCPDHEAALYNSAYALKKKGAIEQALPYYYRVLELNPNNTEAHFSLSLAYLTLGNMQEGWKEYEWRWHRNGFESRTFTQPMWRGESLADKTLFIHAEQGLGDTLQFIRYACIAKQQGAIIIVAVQDALVSLLSLVPYVDTVLPLGCTIPPFDYHIPLLSMPLVLQTRLESIPQEIPYLYAKPELVNFWKNSLAQDPAIKIGICWQGNPNYNTPFLRHAVAAKSIPLKLFAPLASIPGVSLYSLQRISGIEQLNDVSEQFILHQFDDEFDCKHGRFMDTAAVIKNLDLVITVDTSICHLAGGLGVPVWLMLPKPADWRWLLERNDSPWYPTMKLFRQQTPGDWQRVINAMVQELEQSITYYENDSDMSKLIDQATLLYEHEHSYTDPTLHHVLHSYAYALQCQLNQSHHHSLETALHELQSTNQQLIQCDKALKQEHPFHESYTRLAQQLLSLIHKREHLKHTINTLIHKGMNHA